MPQNYCEIQVKVVAVPPLTKFDGEAVVAATDPRYVAALLILNTRSNYQAPDSAVTFPVHSMAFFAIHSPAQAFGTGDVVGQTFRLRIEVDQTETGRRYRLQRL